MRQEGLKSCGKKGRVFRIMLRDLLQEKKVDPKKALTAIFHIKGCGYCHFSIERAIRGAREEGHETDYLRSFSETLFEAEKKLKVFVIKGERHII